MKKVVPHLLLIFLIILSCKEDNVSLKKTALNNSFVQWNKLKASNGEHYSYVISTSSWVGRSTQTRIRVEAGKVIERYFELLSVDQSTGQFQVVQSYTETINELNSHPDGAAPVTLDIVYDLCARNYLPSDRKDVDLFFETDEEGIVAVCGFVPRGCQDDCFEGVRITSLHWN